jgi:hypothetical protein
MHEALTDGEVGEELVLERAEELVVACVRLEVHLPQVGRAVDGHLHEIGCPAGLAGVGERVLAVRPHRRPPHHPRPAHQNIRGRGGKEPTSNSTPPESYVKATASQFPDGGEKGA